MESYTRTTDSAEVPAEPGVRCRCGSQRSHDQAASSSVCTFDPDVGGRREHGQLRDQPSRDRADGVARADEPERAVRQVERLPARRSAARQSRCARPGTHLSAQAGRPGRAARRSRSVGVALPQPFGRPAGDRQHRSLRRERQRAGQPSRPAMPPRSPRRHGRPTPRAARRTDGVAGVARAGRRPSVATSASGESSAKRQERGGSASRRPGPTPATSRNDRGGPGVAAEPRRGGDARARSITGGAGAARWSPRPDHDRAVAGRLVSTPARPGAGEREVGVADAQPLRRVPDGRGR